ncbi:MAG: hypothetical protein V8S77_10340 [Oscillospiraceae bacterium]
MSYRTHPLDPPAADRFLAGGQGLCPQAGGPRALHHGGYRPLFHWEANDYYNEELLYRLFGVNAELLIDHAWGWEPCTIADIKAYKPESNSVGSGQVLQCPYSCEKARLVVREMADPLALDLVDKRLVTDQLVLTVGYDIDNLVSTTGRSLYRSGHHGSRRTKDTQALRGDGELLLYLFGKRSAGSGGHPL